MSHFTKLSKADVRSPEAFLAACKELGFTGEITRDVTITDAVGATKKVSIAVKTGEYEFRGHRRVAHLALEKNEKGRYDIVADFWAVRGHLPSGLSYVHEDKQLHDAVLRTTTKHDIVANYRRQGFVARVTTNADQSINISLSR